MIIKPFLVSNMFVINDYPNILSINDMFFKRPNISLIC